tara:strand:- start:15 stop:350 length:336 start_codon:yes stop_codon:yes gene_type:complete
MVSANNSPALLTESAAASKVLIQDVNQVIDSHVVLINANQAANFNHFKQLSIEYVFVVALALFFVSALYYRRFKSTVLPPPWDLLLKRNPRITLSGWKVSNLLYKAKLRDQ